MAREQDTSISNDSSSSASAGDQLDHHWMEEKRRKLKHGPVLAIGGAEDKFGTTEILDRFIKVAGGKRARIALIPTASVEPGEMVENYRKAFGKLGVASIEPVEISERDDANEDAAINVIAQATGIFVTGGAQSRLVQLLIGTRLMDAIRVRNADGVIVAGTSAGASLMAEHMLLGSTGQNGGAGDSAPRKNMVEVVSGLGLLADVIVDQHFSERGRMGRLLSAFAQNPGLIGIGLDENTAVLVQDGGTLETLGESAVTFVDGRNAISDYFQRQPGEVLTVQHIHTHVLGPGHTFDLVAHAPTDHIGVTATSE